MEEEAKKLIEDFYPFVEGIDKGERHRASVQCALVAQDNKIEDINQVWSQLINSQLLAAAQLLHAKELYYIGVREIIAKS